MTTSNITGPIHPDYGSNTPINTDNEFKFDQPLYYSSSALGDYKNSFISHNNPLHGSKNITDNNNIKKNNNNNDLPSNFDLASWWQKVIEEMTAAEERQHSAASEEARKQREWSTRERIEAQNFSSLMASTQHSRALQDMINAGINPIYAYGGSFHGAAAPQSHAASGAAAQPALGRTKESTPAEAIIPLLASLITGAFGIGNTIIGTFMNKLIPSAGLAQAISKSSIGF